MYYARQLVYMSTMQCSINRWHFHLIFSEDLYCFSTSNCTVLVYMYAVLCSESVAADARFASIVIYLHHLCVLASFVTARVGKHF